MAKTRITRAWFVEEYEIQEGIVVNVFPFLLNEVDD